MKIQKRKFPLATVRALPTRFAVGEACAALGMTRSGMWRWVKAGLPCTYVGKRRARFTRADLEAWLLATGRLS